MPTRKLTSLVKAPDTLALKQKSKKKVPPPPPPPHEKAHREKPPKPGKKHAHKPDDKPRGKHLRRTYEHLGRIEALQNIARVDAVPSLVRLAQSSLDQDEPGSAADLLRAAEHLSFAAAAAKAGAAAALSPELEEAIRREFRKLLEAAEEHNLDPDSALSVLLRQTLMDARSAFDAGNFRQALELARASESLAEIDPEIADQFEKLDAKRALKP